MGSNDECMVCLDNREQCTLIDLACWEDHSIREECLINAVEFAIVDEACHLPTCCNEIDTQRIEQALMSSTNDNNDLVERFRAKCIEYSVPSGLRVYCASKECCTTLGHSRFINHKISGDNDAVICPDCNSITCRLCHELVSSESEHVCHPDDQDKMVLAFILESVPEEDRWLYCKCYACQGWIYKSEQRNHMTCRCTAQFCLICGRKWPESGHSCSHGCPHYQMPVYDEQGYNQNGFHKDSGLDRDGNAHDPHAMLQNDYDEDYDDGFLQYDENGFVQNGFDREGFDDVNGFDQDGLDGDGRDVDGCDEEGFRDGRDREGYDRHGFNSQSYDQNGFGKTGRDSEGYFNDAHDMEGFDTEGFSLTGLHRSYYDSELYDCFGFDVWGYSRSGLDYELREIYGYDVEGFDAQRFDSFGRDQDGYNSEGFDLWGWDRDGFNWRSFNSHHRDKDYNIEPGSSLKPDGNVGRDFYEGPSAKVMECDHRTYFTRVSATCFICRWTSDVFIHQCLKCNSNLCRSCDHSGFERQRLNLRRSYLWPGNDSYGIEGMFGRAERSINLMEEAAMRPLVERGQSISGASEAKGMVDKQKDPGEAFRLV